MITQVFVPLQRAQSQTKLVGMVDPASRAVRASDMGTDPSGTVRVAAAGVGSVGLVVAVIVHPSAARSAAGQVWPPFVLVPGLSSIGLVANDDGLFAAAGHLWLARAARSRVVLWLPPLMVGVVTAVLNLDTSVAFLTPVLVYTARSRAEAKRRCSTAACSSPTPARCSSPART